MDLEKKFRFRKFPVYKDSRVFVNTIRALVKSYFPETEKFSHSSQTLRASNSIILNIAEGTDRGSDKDFARYLNTAHTSLNEVVACLDIALDCEYISKNTHQQEIKKAALLSDQLTAFRKSLLTGK